MSSPHKPAGVVRAARYPSCLHPCARSDCADRALDWCEPPRYLSYDSSVTGSPHPMEASARLGKQSCRQFRLSNFPTRRMWLAILALVSCAIHAAPQQPYAEKIPGSAVAFEMVPVPGGKFRMGSATAEIGRGDEEGT